MNLFKNFLSKKVNISSPATGKLIPLTSVPDEVFSQKIMGDGFAVKPTANELYSPVNGTIISIFPTKHAITLHSDDGLEILMHLGIDTVELKGAPFNIQVKEGQKIKAGDLLGTMNIDDVIKAGKSEEIIIVFTNKDKVKNLTSNASTNVNHGNVIGTVTLA